MFITGISRTKYGSLTSSLAELAYKALYGAIGDSNLTIKDIDAIYISNFLGGPLNNQLHLNSVIASLIPGINIPILRVETACASSSVALYQAILSLERFDNVLVLGVEKMTDTSSFGQTEAIGMAADNSLDQANGLIFPANYALIAQQYMMKYDMKHDILSRLAFINHQNARLNPLAHFYYKDITMDMIEKSPVIASPLNLFDCSPVSDGAAALILSRENHSDRDVKILSSQFSTDSISLTQRSNLTSFKAAKIAAKKAYTESQVSCNDIDILEVHDCFTISELIALEDLGFCDVGSAAEMVLDGSILRDGEIPVNTDGGLKANGHPIGATGIGQIYEVVSQIRGEAELRQLDDVNIGMTHNIGGIGGTAAINILEGV